MGSLTQPGGTEKAGDIKYHAANAIPPGWIKANGAAVSRTAYAALFAVIGTSYGVGDGATTFNVPDLRGEFVRGFDDGRGVDSGRAIGSAQSSQMQSHAHTVPIAPFSGSGGGNRESVTGAGGSATTSSTAGGTSNGNEDRPRNIAMLACIKY